ncbi:hypothetical protein EJB05_37456, partial [Eragrostis curvula]
MFRATLADKTKHYEEVVDAMNRIAMLDMVLTLHERNLLSLGYKKVSAEKHASVRALIYMEVEEEERNTIDNHLLPYSSDAENKAFYYQMNGDYYRYLAEFKMQPEYSEVVDQSLKAYALLQNQPLLAGKMSLRWQTFRPPLRLRH